MTWNGPSEKAFGYAVDLARKAYDGQDLVDALVELAALDGFQISAKIDALQQVTSYGKPKLPSAPASATASTWQIPKGKYVVDGKVYKIQYSKTTGAAYVLTEHGFYLGVFHPEAVHVLAKLADKATALAAVVAYGTAHHRCGVCGLKLTDPKSIAKKIGPVCEKKYA